MLNTLITHLQIFGIGLTFGIIGPCFMICTPLILTYITGTSRRPVKMAIDALMFFTGRLFAYLALGFMAGASGAILKGFMGSGVLKYFQYAGGILSFILAIIVLSYKADESTHCMQKPLARSGILSLLMLGLTLGIMPCPPLISLLSEIIIISKSGIDGMLYSLSFGLGTSISGLIVIGILGGAVSGLMTRFIKSSSGGLFVRMACAGLLVLFGIGMIVSQGHGVTIRQ